MGICGVPVEMSSVQISSSQNPRFRRLRQLLQARGIRRQAQALVGGMRLVREALALVPQRCRALVVPMGVGDFDLRVPPGVQMLELSAPLFAEIDQLGTGAPLLLVDVPPINPWGQSEERPGPRVLVAPFQDPENLGAALRSAAAFGVRDIALMPSAAHPWLPRAVRAASGAHWHLRFWSLAGVDALQAAGYALLWLSMEGRPLDQLAAPAPPWALVPGIEGAGVPDDERSGALAIPMSGPIESLNAAVAVGIVLHWLQSAER